MNPYDPVTDVLRWTLHDIAESTARVIKNEPASFSGEALECLCLIREQCEDALRKKRIRP